MLSRSPVRAAPAVTATLITAMLCLTALALPAGQAKAGSAADTITIAAPVTITALGGTGGERLAVTATSTTALQSMTVHVLSTVTSTSTAGTASTSTTSTASTSTAGTAGTAKAAAVLSLPMRPPARGAEAGASTWTSDGITTAILPLGSYTLTVDATDTGGAAVTGVPAGAFPFRDTPRIAAAAGDYVLSGANRHPVIDGTITELAPGATTPAPYADQPIVLHDPVEGDIYLTTDSAGDYRKALPKPVAGETITAEVLPTATTAATRARPVMLTVRTAITGFTASLNPYWQVAVHGCLGLAPGTPGGLAPGGGFRPPAGLIVEYSSGPHGPWHPLGPVAAARGRACGHDGATFAGTAIARLSGAYYRVSYPGSAGQRETAGDLPSVSAAAHAWKHLTRVAGFTVSQRSVAGGGKLTTSGRLLYHTGGAWRALAGQVVQIILLPEGSRTWYWIARVTTSAAGYFTATFTDPVTATWSAEYLGDPTCLAAVGAMIGVTLT